MTMHLLCTLSALFLLAMMTAAEPTTPAQAPTLSTQFAAQRLDFLVGTNRAFLIQPTRPAADGSKPWIWFAPTLIGHHPDKSHEWLFHAALERGFTIAGIDVGESFGNQQGHAAFTAFHRFVTTTYGLAAKACLVPQSRGGLMLYNWAAEHPESVQCIAGIYTVCDLRSYPGLATAGPAYGFTAEDWQTQLPNHNPIDRLAPIAAAHIPILIVHGDADRVVPLPVNSAELITRYRALGGPGELIIVPGKGHQVCDEFFHCQALQDFLLGQGSAK